ncbi:predicted protein [Histoplasma mississippiense (nom. inval.)]|uniref:predicted protein n=1 Tax=Ajellomyces capsulatus (strain NAm1 / WU24) TaxID=2059318 RepID=UPI000157C940|nr:predicted protein [Histoplasma mississippiense (nom. inval.)]EDN09455.1 predicted protein [Histoplasma mississippiense (nom. inval.)]
MKGQDIWLRKLAVKYGTGFIPNNQIHPTGPTALKNKSAQLNKKRASQVTLGELGL